MKKTFKVLLVSLFIFSALVPSVGAQAVEVSSIITSENINTGFTAPKAITPDLSEAIKRATFATPIKSNELISSRAATLTLVQSGLNVIGFAGAEVYYMVTDVAGNRYVQ
ncbi:hypothetical protein ACP8HI_13645 [Paenibacillus sp. FA6]|uniref:hypothetical protein n=1 Tax=Paenibacillus sp. FA6 TaxID=3413029 RepID=UPI003F65EB9C